MTLFSYSAFGLSIRSELELPELVEGSAPFDVTIRFGTVPENLDEPTGRGVLYQVTPTQLLLKIPENADYLVSRGEEIVIQRAPEVTDAQVRLYLLGGGFGALLHQRGMLPIHGSAIATPRGAVIFAGPSRRGKSTLAWAFHRRGYRILCDDVSTVGFDENGMPLVYPAYPQINLWADVLDRDGTPHADLQAVHPKVEKYGLPARESFDPAPIPLFAIYLLETTNTNELSVTPIKGMEKLRILAINTYRPRYVRGMGKGAEHFRLATRAGQNLRARRVVRPVNSFILDALADLIEKDFAG